MVRGMKMLKHITKQLSQVLSIYIIMLIMLLLVLTPLMEYHEVRASMRLRVCTIASV